MVAIGGKHFVESIGGGQHHFGNQRGVFLGQLRRKNVFELMRQLAKFAKATSRGIALQGVDRASNAAKIFLVRWTLFEREANFIHVLEDFRGAFKEKLAKL